jgi:predicted aspartyl protease
VELIVADGRKIHARYVVLDSVSVQGVEARKVEAAVLSEDRDPNMKDGLLGMSFLKRFKFNIDLQNTKLSLEKPR